MTELLGRLPRADPGVKPIFLSIKKPLFRSSIAVSKAVSQKIFLRTISTEKWVSCGEQEIQAD
ncbi:hypothetical protein T03_5400 [Trichinella britovi]|uniref:Uncharacterized protein n=1 Tax=Trichinella britovi TaxID=45882 RepID=A0A0V1D0T4_TRIBR|nr:hypothetical protein T03_5400 [Trichinella britovi]